jgi:hypothetical protein
MVHTSGVTPQSLRRLAGDSEYLHLGAGDSGPYRPKTPGGTGDSGPYMPETPGLVDPNGLKSERGINSRLSPPVVTADSTLSPPLLQSLKALDLPF